METELTKSSDYLSDLRKLISAYLSQYRDEKAGYEALSKVSYVSVRSLSRIMQAKDTKAPHGSTVVKILKAIFSVNDRASILSKVPQALALYLREKCSFEEHYDNGKLQAILNHKLEHDLLYRQIYILACLRLATKESVKQRYGDYGLEKLSDLAADGLVSYLEDFVQIEAVVYTGLKASHKVCVDLLEAFYYPDKCSQVGENIHRYLLGQVSPVAYNEILRVQLRAHEQIAAIMSDVANSGNVPVWAVNACDTGLEKPYGNGEVLQ